MQQVMVNNYHGLNYSFFCILTFKATAISIINHNFSSSFYNTISGLLYQVLEWCLFSYPTKFLHDRYCKLLVLVFFYLFQCKLVFYIYFLQPYCLFGRYIELLILQHDDIICCIVPF